ncbi:hypothetical protein [Terribacillus halophilus]|uniref:hypothetical protein n=1 Tax=Terribacillus halophilus TaxID=361279 RepID=UPI00147C78F2|nr:hypothetical protein [Terribacillus halophilus]
MSRGNRAATSGDFTKNAVSSLPEQSGLDKPFSARKLDRWLNDSLHKTARELTKRKQ